MNETYEKPWFSFGCVGTMTRADVRNLGRFNLWMMGWALSWVGALVALRSAWAAAPALRWAAVAVPIALALAAILAYLRFLREADELLRKIHLEGMAYGFGVAFVLSTGAPLAERAGAPALEGSVLWAAMVIGWAIGQLVGRRRYA